MTKLFFLAAGGAIGTLMRYWLSVRFNHESFPWGTLIVNISGSFLIGIIAGSTLGRVNQEFKLFATAGVLGGFTTFSGFTLEGLQLIRNQQFTAAILYMAGSCLLGLAAAAAGFALARQWE